MAPKILLLSLLSLALLAGASRNPYWVSTGSHVRASHGFLFYSKTPVMKRVNNIQADGTLEDASMDQETAPAMQPRGQGLRVGALPRLTQESAAPSISKFSLPQSGGHGGFRVGALTRPQQFEESAAPSTPQFSLPQPGGHGGFRVGALTRPQQFQESAAPSTPHFSLPQPGGHGGFRVGALIQRSAAPSIPSDSQPFRSGPMADADQPRWSSKSGPASVRRPSEERSTADVDMPHWSSPSGVASPKFTGLRTGSFPQSQGLLEGARKPMHAAPPKLPILNLAQSHDGRNAADKPQWAHKDKEAIPRESRPNLLTSKVVVSPQLMEAKIKAMADKFREDDNHLDSEAL